MNSNLRLISVQFVSFVTIGILLLSCLFFSGVQTVDAAQHQVRIGILAKRGTSHCLNKWEVLTDYLSRKIPGEEFQIIPLAFDKIDTFVKDRKVDFVIVNTAIYVELEYKYHVSRIATMCNSFGDQCSTLYGSAIFVRKGSTIESLTELKQKDVAAVDPTSLGGWLIALRQLKLFHVDPDDFHELSFMGTHDAVVMAVLRGKADAGIVRSDTLERMAQEGKISLDAFRILDADTDTDADATDDFPFLLSTPLYPEWPMAKLESTPDELAQKVAAALFEMQAGKDGVPAATTIQWTIPLNYNSVHDLLKELRVTPYQNYGLISLWEATVQHWPGVLGMFAGSLLLALFAVHTQRLNRQLHVSRSLVEQELSARKAEENRRKTVESMVRHELRSPVISVRNSLTLLQGSECLSEETEIIHLACDAADRALKTIDLQRELASLENNTFVPPESIVDLTELVREVLAEYENLSQSMDVSWTIDCDGAATVKTKGDRELFAVLLSNLFRNALEAVSADSTIRIVLGSEEQPVLRISNDGAVPDDIRDVFFERFTTSGKAGGTGLGTYIVKVIAEGHGGRVSMRSSEEEGTEISVFFPVAE